MAKNLTMITSQGQIVPASDPLRTLLPQSKPSGQVKTDDQSKAAQSLTPDTKIDPAALAKGSWTITIKRDEMGRAVSMDIKPKGESG